MASGEEYHLLMDGGIRVLEKYGEIGYRNYLTQGSFTFDMGAHYYLYKFRASLYWACTNVCPKSISCGATLAKESLLSGTGTIGRSWDPSITPHPPWPILRGDVLEFPKQERKDEARAGTLSGELQGATHNAYFVVEVTLWAWNYVTIRQASWEPHEAWRLKIANET